MGFEKLVFFGLFGEKWQSAEEKKFNGGGHFFLTIVIFCASSEIFNSRGQEGNSAPVVGGEDQEVVSYMFHSFISLIPDNFLFDLPYLNFLSFQLHLNASLYQLPESRSTSAVVDHSTVLCLGPLPVISRYSY